MHSNDSLIQEQLVDLMVMSLLWITSCCPQTAMVMKIQYRIANIQQQLLMFSHHVVLMLG